MESSAGPSSSGRSRKAPERLSGGISWGELDASGYGGGAGDDDQESGEDLSGEDSEDFSGSDSDYDDPDGARGGFFGDDEEQQQDVQGDVQMNQTEHQGPRGLWRERLMSRMGEDGEGVGPGNEIAEVEGMDKERMSGLVAKVRGDGPDPSRPSRNWDDTFEADAAAFQNDLRKVAGFKSVKKGVGRGHRGKARIELSGEVKQLMGEATVAFVESRENKAIDLLEQVIKIEPGALEAWTLLRNCFLAIDEEYKAIQVGIIVAGMSTKPNALWRELAEDSRAKGMSQQALYCFAEAIKADRKDLETMWDRGELLEELGQFKSAADQFNSMWKLVPYDAEIRDKIIINWMLVEEYQKVINLSADCYEHARKFFPKGDLPSSDQEKIDINAIKGSLTIAHVKALLANGNTYGTQQLHTLAEAYLWTRKYEDAVNLIRQGTRWFQGRAHEKHWDDLEDDREFDDDREEPTGGRREDQGKRGRAIDRAAVHHLDDELRLSLGRARISSGELEEGKRHFNILTTGVDPDEYNARFEDIANQYLEAQMWSEAILILNALLESDQATHRHHHTLNYSRLASAYYSNGDLKAAVEYYESIVDTEKDDLDSKLRLAEILEELGDRYRALQLVNEVVRARQAIQHAERNSTDASLAQAAAQQSQQLNSQLSFFDEINLPATQTGQKPRRSQGTSRSGVRKMTNNQRQNLEKQREEQAQEMWTSLRLQEDEVFAGDWWHKDVMLDGDLTEEEERRAREDPSRLEELEEPQNEEARTQVEYARRILATRDWMETAGKLVESFRATRALFPMDRKTKFKGVVKNRRRKRVDLDSQATELMSRIQNRMYDEADENREEEDTQEHTAFRSVDLDEWIELFMKYAFVLTKVGDYAAVKEMFSDILNSNVVHNSEERKVSLTLCQAACALYCRDYDELYSLMRILPVTYQFIDEPLRMVAAVGSASGSYGMRYVSLPSNLKVYNRRVRLIETIVSGRFHIYNSSSGRWLRPLQATQGSVALKARSKFRASAESESDQEQGNEDSEGGEDEEYPENDLGGSMSAPTASERLARRRYGYPDKNSPVGELFYGSMLLLGRSHGGALAYYLRAYAREPRDALTCLLIATACFGRVTPREVDNRHHCVLQGMAFLTLYRDARGGTNQETEYNYGRAFHQIGLLHLAVPHYQKVISLQEEAESNGTDTKSPGFEMYQEAAYNLSLILTLSGNTSLARKYMT